MIPPTSGSVWIESCLAQAVSNLRRVHWFGQAARRLVGTIITHAPPELAPTDGEKAQEDRRRLGWPR